MTSRWVRPGDLPPDPGLQPERTVLAWRRTWLAAAGTLGLVVRAVLLLVDDSAGTAAATGTAVAWVCLSAAVAGGLLLAVAAFLRGPDHGTLSTAAGAVLLIAAALAVVLVDLLAS